MFVSTLESELAIGYGVGLVNMLIPFTIILFLHTKEGVMRTCFEFDSAHKIPMAPLFSPFCDE